MKRKITTYLIAFIALFCINKVGVDAIICSYGVREGNDASTWNKRFQFDVEAWDKVYINQIESPEINGSDSKAYKVGALIKCKSNSECHSDINPDYQGAVLPSEPVYIFVSLFSNESMYNNLKGKCPKLLRYSDKLEVRFFRDNRHFLFIYNDDLDDPSMKLNDVDFDSEEEEVFLILESEKASPLEKIKGTGCPTYDSYLDEMKIAINKSESKSCDNNQAFNEMYQKVSQICESYRSTSLYVENDDGKISAKSCSKACSRLRDDVTKICGKDLKDNSCGSLGNRLINWVFKIIRIIRYAIPVLLIILSILDFIKAIASDSEDEMKKVTGRFVKRLIAAVLIFIIPFILDFVLKIFDLPGLTENPFCAK